MATSRLADDPNLVVVLKEIVDCLVDSCLMDGIMVMHRAIKLGYFHVIAPDPSDETSTEVKASGNSARDASTKTAGCCRCVKCHCKVAATRFAPHLSNCMGLGRNSSRRANKRIAEQQRLEDFDGDEVTETTAIFSSASNSTIHSSDSICPRFTNGTLPMATVSSTTTTTASKQHSPLKMTISLVPVNGKPEGRQHVARPVPQVGQTSDHLALTRQNNTKNNTTASASPLSFSSRSVGGTRGQQIGSASKSLSGKPTSVLLKDAVVPLIPRHLLPSEERLT